MLATFELPEITRTNFLILFTERKAEEYIISNDSYELVVDKNICYLI
jgi:hypothetical protein